MEVTEITAGKVLEKNTRTKEDIQRDYSRYCAQAGEHQYKIKVLEGQLASLNQNISDLSTEAETLAKETQNGQTQSN